MYHKLSAFDLFFHTKDIIFSSSNIILLVKKVALQFSSQLLLQKDVD